MGRHTVEITIPGDPNLNRDAGKTFKITEMPASQAERWATKALGAMMRSGMDIPQNAMSAGIIGVAMVGIKALLSAPSDETLPLLDEMFGCVALIVEAMPQGRPLVEEDIEEVSTRLHLREEIMSLHAGFSLRAVLSNLGRSVTEGLKELSKTTQASDPSSEPSSRTA